jgi:hypothetical protein
MRNDRPDQIQQLEDDPVATLEIAVLRAAADLRAEAAPSADPSPDEAEFRTLAADSAARLRGQLDRPQREPGDWSVTLPAGGCTCDLCATLREFLAAPDRRVLEWPLAKQGRQHVHTRIDAAEAPVARDQAPGQPVHPRPAQDRRPVRRRAEGTWPSRLRPQVARK